MRRGASPPRLAVIFDAPEERWPSMELAGELLLAQLDRSYRDRLEATRLQWGLPAIARAVSARPGPTRLVRGLGRYLHYPARTLASRSRFDLFHLVDHSYAHLVNVLPPGRAGVYCHDLDAFRSLLSPSAEPRPLWFRGLARSVLLGLRRAARVFYASEAVREEILRHRLVPPERLVQAPLGAAEEFVPRPETSSLSGPLAALEGRAFVLHVGSEIPRKRLDVLFEAFAMLRQTHPDLRLVQVGANLSGAQRSQVHALGIQPSLFQPPHLTRSQLAGLYRRAEAVVLTSEREGFGLPLLEALACGAPVVASDILPFREIGGDAVEYCEVGRPPAFAQALERVLLRATAPLDRRLARARCFAWESHARAIADVYLGLDAAMRVGKERGR